MNIPYYREYTLPWSVSSDDERQFRKTLFTTMGVLVFLGVVWPYLPVKEKDPLRWKKSRRASRSS